MKLPTLYKKTSSGAIQVWTIEVEGAKYRTHHGQLDGKIVTTDWYSTSATNVGRSNQRSAEEQAEFEAEAAWKKKIDSGAKQSLQDVDAKEFHTPMLAKKFEDRDGKFSYPILSQPKLDGLRAVISKDGAFTRGGKKWVAIPHILEALKPIFEKYPHLVLDGELYTHEYKDDFNKICSLVKKTNPSASDIAETASKVEFWWYDIFTDDGKNTQRFSQRFDLIRELCETFGYGGWPIVAVPTATVHSREELDELYGQYLDDGYEGQMVRLDEPYENKRSASLLKRKTFSDDEYKIIEICEGNGNKSGMAGYAIMEREDGVRFRSNIKGNHEFLKDLLVQCDRYSGKYGTVKYFNLTPDGIPRFPYLIRMREGVSTD